MLIFSKGISQTISVENIVEKENILMKSLQDKVFHSLTAFERQLCSVQGKMFELSAKKNLSSKEFIDFYMQSKTAAFFDLPYDRTQWMGEANLLQDVLDEKSDFPKGNIFDSESLFWIGYTYRYWHFFTGQSSKEISQICNAEIMDTIYPAYHTLDFSMAIERILESSNLR